MGSLVLTYFRERGAHYHWRGLVSRSCSGWEGVVPRRYGHQTETGYDLGLRQVMGSEEVRG